MSYYPKLVLLVMVLLAPLFTSFNPMGSGRVHRVEFEGNTYRVYVVNLRSDSVAMFYKMNDTERYGNFENLRKGLQKRNRKLLFATNGGMFTPAHDPVGLYIENRRELFPLDTGSGTGNFYLKPNGVFSINYRLTGAVQSTEEYGKMSSVPKFATQSGPMLVTDKKINPAFKRGSANKYIRSGVGQVGSSMFVFAISDKPVNFFDFANLFKSHYQCTNALYLDGAISKFYINEEAENSSALQTDFGVLIGHYE